MGSQNSGLHGLTVISFESRRATEMAALIRRHGGIPVVAPSMREIPLEDNPAALDLLQRLQRGEVDIVILLTGVGTRTLAEAVAGTCPRDRFADLLRKTTIVARGPKPVAALRAMGLQPSLAVPEPNTWRELLSTLDEKAPVSGRRVAVQEYGVTNPELIEGLTQRGANLLRVPVYRWALPDDPGPLRDAVRRLATGDADVVLFTSGNQVYNVFQVAEEMGVRDALVGAAASALIASIGPVCSEALEVHGLHPDLEPDHSKMGQLVTAVARRGRSLLEAKRGRRGLA